MEISERTEEEHAMAKRAIDVLKQYCQKSVECDDCILHGFCLKHWLAAPTVWEK